MSCHIRPFRDDDGPHLVEILKRNNQLAFPDVDGLDAMLRVARCDAAVFLVAEFERSAGWDDPRGLRWLARAEFICCPSIPIISAAALEAGW